MRAWCSAWCAWPGLSLVAIAACGAGAFYLSAHTPTGFLPEEDQGAFFIAAQLPDGASVARTAAVAAQVEKLLHAMPQVQDTLSIIGFSLLDGVYEPNAAFMVARLKPFADRTGAADRGAGADRRASSARCSRSVRR